MVAFSPYLIIRLVKFKSFFTHCHHILERGCSRAVLRLSNSALLNVLSGLNTLLCLKVIGSRLGRRQVGIMTPVHLLQLIRVLQSTGRCGKHSCLIELVRVGRRHKLQSDVLIHKVPLLILHFLFEILAFCQEVVGFFDFNVVLVHGSPVECVLQK